MPSKSTNPDAATTTEPAADIANDAAPAPEKTVTVRVHVKTASGDDLDAFDVSGTLSRGRVDITLDGYRRD